MNDDFLKNKRILIFQQRRWGIGIGTFLARKLQERGCRLAAMTFKRTTHKFITEESGVKYDFLVSNDDLISFPREFLREGESSLDEICQELGVDSVWPIVQTLRLHVKSYKEKFYYSFFQNVSDDEIVLYVKAVFATVKKVFREFSPQVIISPNFGDLFHIFFNIYAAKRGVRMLVISDCKVRGQRVFTYSYNEDRGPFIDRVRELNLGQVETQNREKARQYIAEFREQFVSPDYADKKVEKPTFIRQLRHFLSPYYHIIRWYTNRTINYLPTIGVSIDYRPPRIILRDHWARDAYKRFTDRFGYYPFDRVGNFVYFPLQFQPESTIDVSAPFFSNQIETARQIAMSLPGDYTLVVKEHPAMVGYRAPSYTTKISRTPNVKLIDYRTPNQEVFRKASLVVSPNGTTLAEAAMYAKPAIQLGNLGTTLMLPNVTLHSDMTTLASKIKELLKLELGGAEYERKLENYVAAAYDVGFDFNYAKAWHHGEGNFEFLWEMYRHELKKVL